VFPPRPRWVEEGYGGVCCQAGSGSREVNHSTARPTPRKTGWAVPMQAGPEVSAGLKERQIACIKGTMGVHVARMIHMYLYVANPLWDTDRISRLDACGA
jgi:hypothetical protein